MKNRQTQNPISTNCHETVQIKLNEKKFVKASINYGPQLFLTKHSLSDSFLLKLYDSQNELVKLWPPQTQ